jgi:predicted RNase H-like nuclease (RuvC/YqgF family)
MTVDEAIEIVRDPNSADPITASRVLAAEVERLRAENNLLKAGVRNMADEVERLRASEDRLETLLSDALAHTPESYHKPILEILRKRAADAA